MDVVTLALLEDEISEVAPELIAEATDDWLEENVAPETGYVLDSTLTMSNAAAPANKVGELKTAFTQLDNEINNIVADSNLWSQGYWAIANGASQLYTTDWIRTKDFILEDVDIIFNNSNLLMYLQAWNKSDSSYVGTWNGSAFTTTYIENTGLTNIDFTTFLSEYPLYKFKISIKEITGKNITPTVDGAKVNFAYNKLDDIREEINAVEVSGEVDFKSADVYENGEISLTENMYEYYPSGSNLKRARIKQEYIQEIPTGSTTVTYSISQDAFANGKYKIGWAQYRENYSQIQSTVGGWFTSPTTNVQSINENAKYIMFYIATVSDNDTVDVNTLPLDAYSVVFDSTPIDYGRKMLHRNFNMLYPEVDDRISNLENYDNILQKDYFIYSINHRGYNTEAPENTIPAFVLSRKKGFSYVECDVQFTSDNVAVLLHDATINRTARNADGTELSSTVNIADITYEQALTYDFGIFKGEKWAGTKIPTFEEILIACKKLSVHPFIELKDQVSGTYWTDARITTIANTVKNCGMENNVSFISFAVSALQKISTYFPKSTLGLGFEGDYTQENFSTFITNAETLLSDDHDIFATVNYGSMTSTLYAMLTTAGINPVVWAVNTKSAVLSLYKSVVGVLSDSLNAGEILVENMLETIE